MSPRGQTVTPATSIPAERSKPAPEAQRKSPLEPVWAPEPQITPKLAATLEPAKTVTPQQIPNWERAAASTAQTDTRWGAPSKAPSPRRPAPRAPTPVGSATRPARPPRSRTFATVAVLASLFVVFIVVVAIMALLHHPASTPGPAAASKSSVSTADVAHVRTAVAAAETATTKAVTSLHSLSGFPTPTKVANVINPYVDTLQNLKTALRERPLPVAARTAAISAHALVTRDVQFLGTINGLPSLKLGTYLGQFGKDAAQLQTTLHHLNSKLPVSHR